MLLLQARKTLSLLSLPLDSTLSQDSSFFALWTDDAPDPPDLATATAIGVLDGTILGNFMIRAFGVDPPVIVVPTLGESGLALLVVLLGLAGAVFLRRL